jgi:cell division protein FtsL
MHQEFIVRPHRPRRRLVFWTATTLSIVLALLGAFVYGQWQAGFDRARTNSEIADLKAQLKDVHKRNADLHDQVVALERAREIDKAAHDQVQQNLSNLQAKMVDLREELAFYRGIVSPQDSSTGLKVQSLAVSSAGEAGHFHYKLVLIQARSHRDKVAGSVNIQVTGEAGGKTVSQAVAGKSAQGKALAFSFRYFQNIEGDFTLPDGFKPTKVVVKVDSRSHKAPITQVFDWNIVKA